MVKGVSRSHYSLSFASLIIYLVQSFSSFSKFLEVLEIIRFSCYFPFGDLSGKTLAYLLLQLLPRGHVAMSIRSLGGIARS